MGYGVYSPPARTYPGLLDTTYDPVGLWQFDGNYLNSGTAGTGTGADFSVARGTERYGRQSTDKQCAYFDTALGLQTAATADAALRVAGDVTVQLVYQPLIKDIGVAGTSCFVCGGHDSAQANNEMYAFILNNTASRLNMKFRWEHSTGTRVDVQDTSTAGDLVDGQPNHIVARRWTEDAGTTQEGELWINGVLVASVTGQTPCDGGTTSPLYMGKNPSNNVYYQDSLIYCAKVVDRKLTDAELLDEFIRTGLATALS